MAKASKMMLESQPIPTRPILSHENWKIRTLKKLELLEKSGTSAVSWAGPLHKALDSWETDEDIRWRENLKFYYLHSNSWAHSSRSSVASEKKSMWIVSGLTTENIFRVSSHVEFLDNQLHCCQTHGIAFLIFTFVDAFANFYRDKESCTDVMKQDVAEFSALAEDALELYYEPIDILALFKKSKQYLGYLIREVVLEDASVRSQFLAAIKRCRTDSDCQLREHRARLRDCDILQINPLTKPLLVSISRAKPGFSACISILRNFATLNKLNDQVQAIYELSQSMSDAILHHGDTRVELDPDDLLTLCAFFLVRTDQEDVGACVELLASIVPTDVMADATSYTLATLESALEYLARRLPDGMQSS